jgi:hypothetical protein
VAQNTLQRDNSSYRTSDDDSSASLRAYRNQLIAELREVNRLLASGRIVPTANSGLAT